MAGLFWAVCRITFKCVLLEIFVVGCVELSVRWITVKQVPNHGEFPQAEDFRRYWDHILAGLDC